MRLRSSSDSCSRSISRSVSTSSSMPRKAKVMYQSQTTRRNMREKKSIQSSSAGMPLDASRGGGVGSALLRNRGSSMKSPVSSNSGSAVSDCSSASAASNPTSGLFRSGICSGSIPRASAASGVIPLFGGLILPVCANGDLFRFVIDRTRRLR